MKEKRKRLKEVTNIPKYIEDTREPESGCVVSDTELLILDDVVSEGSVTMLLSDYQIDVEMQEKEVA